MLGFSDLSSVILLSPTAMIREWRVKQSPELFSSDLLDEKNICSFNIFQLSACLVVSGFM